MNTTYVRSEIRRSFRTPRYLIFAFGMPLLMFFVFGRAYGGGTLGGISVPAYIMVSMATFGAMSAVFGTGGRIAMERVVGWNRQLRLTALSGRGYVSGKALAGFAVAVPSLALVFVAGAVFHHVDLSAGRWAALAASILLALLPIAALGVLIGYVAKSDSLQAVSGGIYSLLALFGGLWIPVQSFPTWLVDVCKALPVYWVADAGREVLQGHWLGWEGVGVLAAWTVVLGVLAARAYRRSTARG
jgi:ABC-2 type transport system permease protein